MFTVEEIKVIVAEDTTAAVVFCAWVSAAFPVVATYQTSNFSINSVETFRFYCMSHSLVQSACCFMLGLRCHSGDVEDSVLPWCYAALIWRWRLLLSVEMFETICQSTQHNIPENINLQYYFYLLYSILLPCWIHAEDTSMWYEVFTV